MGHIHSVARPNWVVDKEAGPSSAHKRMFQISSKLKGNVVAFAYYMNARTG